MQFKTHQPVAHRIGAMLSMFICLAAPNAKGAETNLDFEPSWEEPSPRLFLRGTSGSEVSNGKLIRYALQTMVPAHCYLVKKDARGDFWLSGMSPCATGAPAVAARALIPEDSAIELQSVAGKEQITAYLVREPLQLSGLSAQKMPWLRISGKQFESLAAQLQVKADSGTLAVARVEYDVTEDVGELQFTTRAILQQVQDATESSSGQGVLTTFNVDAIRFEFDSAKPTPAGIRQMKAFGEALVDPMLAEMRVVIGGHTDDLGTDEHNIDLSRARSEAVKDYFTQQFGVDAARISTRAYGETRPLVANSGESNRAKNRRVEIEFLY